MKAQTRPHPPDGPPGPVPDRDEDLRALLAGDVVEHYPDITARLVTAGPEELQRAGQLLARVDPALVLARHPRTPVLTVAMTGHGMLAPLVPLLTGQFARHGLLLRPVLSDYDSYVVDLSDPASGLYAARPDVALCVLDPAMVFDEVPVPWRPGDVGSVLERKVRQVSQLADAFKAAARGVLVLNTIPLPRRYTAQLIDHRSRAELGALWREANARLLRLGQAQQGVVVIDLDPLLADGAAADDARLRTYAKVQLSPALLEGYAREVGHLSRNLVGATKKCLAVDLDGTLWGGTLAEDGTDGIEVAHTPRGEAFHAVRQVVKQLASQGIPVAVLSKNDDEAVRGALRNHQDMVLREQDFVRIAANWGPKHVNLAELAASLNVAADSFVFMDDTPSECGMVRLAVPGAAIVQVDGDPARHTELLLRDGWFDTRELTEADHARVEMYRQDLARQDFIDAMPATADYLAELEISARLGAATERDVARLSQLTLRTNQFNLTTRRLQPGDVREYIDAPGRQALAVHSSDRFGSNGLVGALFLSRHDTALTIDNFVLSCRVFSRGIEQACLAAVLDHARAEGLDSVVGNYRPTSKNAKFSDFYERHGFCRTGGDLADATYRHDLRDPVQPPAYLAFQADFWKEDS